MIGHKGVGIRRDIGSGRIGEEKNVEGYDRFGVHF